MLAEARRAGEALLAAKAKLPHGSFKAWVEANCSFTYDRAMRYMRVAKIGDVPNFTGGIDAFLDAHATKRPPSATATPPSFTKDEAEYVLKINARAERGVDGECDVAARKLEKIAAEHGMSDAAALVEKAPSFRR